MNIRYWFILCVLLLASCAREEAQEEVSKVPVTDQPTERFVREQLMNERGELRTNVTTQRDHYLSESLGLWLQYLVQVDDQATFEQMRPTIRSWMTADGAVYWVRDNGKYGASNASIDDLRIASAYVEAYEKWGQEEDYAIAEEIVHYFAKNQVVNGFFLDFYDLIIQKEGNVQTTSYYDERALRQFASYGWLDDAFVERWIQQRQTEPTDGSIYPPTRYVVDRAQYEFDEEVNGIDIAYTLFHREEWTAKEHHLYESWRNVFMEEGVLVGRMDRQSKPLASFESPAMYALLGRAALRQGDGAFAQQLYAKLLDMQSKSAGKEGQFVDERTGDLHVFDHLLFLIFEQEVAYDNMG